MELILTNLIYDYNFNSSVKILKNDLRPILNRLFGSDGDYFYGVGIKNQTYQQFNICDVSLQNLMYVLMLIKIIRGKK